MSTLINNIVLMSGVDYFSVKELNPYSNVSIQPTIAGAKKEHDEIYDSLVKAGITVTQVPPPRGCQDGVYTANWGLCRGDTVILSSLPNERTNEEPYATQVLSSYGFHTIKAPYRFSGQGDALPCGNLLFCGSTYRTDPRMHDFIADKLGYEIIRLRTVPEVDITNKPVVNKVTGWPDSFFYDIDLAIAVLTPTLIAWCPAAFTRESQDTIRCLDIDKIEVSLDEARDHFACNLISTGQTVVMSDSAPTLQKAIEAKGLHVITPTVHELSKGGGYIRCTTLTLDNQ